MNCLRSFGVAMLLAAPGLATAAVATAAVATAAGVTAAGAKVNAPHPFNILLMTCDALRADHLGAYGYPRPTSPNINAFAKEATVFANAVGQSAWTGPGIVSLLTGQYPAVHGMDTRHKVPDRFLPTVLKDLGARGYRATAFQATGDLYSNLGLGSEDQMRFTLPELLRKVGGEPFAIWYHFRNSHLPYHARPELQAQFARPESPPLPADHLALLTLSPVIPAGTVTWEPSERSAIVDLYDAAVRQNDDDVGAAFATLRELGLWENTIVVLTADHAEELLEHGQVGHASTTQAGTLYEELLRVPLIVRVPGTPGGRVVPGLAQPVDVMPTVLDALGLRADPRLQGRSLLPEVRGERDRVPREIAFSETTDCGWQCAGNRQKTGRLWAAKSSHWKLIVRRDESARVVEERLFDLQQDPAETHSVLTEEPQTAATLRRALAAHIADNLVRARAALATALAGHRQEIEQLPAPERSARAGAVCDELAMLHYVYRVQNPSVFEDAAAAKLWRRETAAILGLLPAATRRYWACGAPR